MKYTICFSLICLSLALKAQINPGIGVFPQDSCFFETPCPLIQLDTAHSGVWQVAQPNKPFFDSAYSPINALVTDPLNPYPQNEQAYFDLYVPHYNGISTIVSFKHRYQTDSLKDGGYLEISHDMGQSWRNIIEEIKNPPYVANYQENLYEETDTIEGGIPAFSGSSGWIDTRIQWIWALPVKSIYDTSILRFHFRSDSLDNSLAGWMIDDIRTYFVDFPGSVSPGIDKIGLEIAPHPIRNQSILRFENVKRNPLDFELLNLQGQVLYKISGIRGQELTFKKQNIPAGIYFIRFSSEEEVLATQKIILMD